MPLLLGECEIGTLDSMECETVDRHRRRGQSMPAILIGLGALVQKVLEATVVGALIGALFGGAIGAGTEAVHGIQEHGEVNETVIINAAQRGAEDALEGAAVGGAFGGAVVIIAPAVAPVAGLVDDIARPAFRAVGKSAKTVLKRSGVLVHSTIMSTEKVVLLSLKQVRKKLPPPIQRLLPKSSRSTGFVYVMEDTATGAKKIGMSVDPSKRLGQVQGKVGNKVNLSCTIPTYNMRALEAALHSAFASQRLPNTGAGTEWFKLNANQVSAICN